MHQGCHVPFRISRGNEGFLSRRCSEKGPHLVITRKPPGFSRVAVGFSSYDGDLRDPLVLPQGSPNSIQVAKRSWGLLSSLCRANRLHLGLCSETLCSSPVATEISGLHSKFTRGVTSHFKLKQRTLHYSRDTPGISWSPFTGLKGVKPSVDF